MLENPNDATPSIAPPKRLSGPGRPGAFDIVTMAASVGGIGALIQVLGTLPPDFPVSILVVQHISARVPSRLVEVLGRYCSLSVTWATTGHAPRRGTVYLAPPDWHLTISGSHTMQLSQGARVRFVRPSADVLFESVAATYGSRSIGVVLTGTGRDGAHGAKAIKHAAGRVLAQDAVTSAAFGMPGAAIATGCVDFALPLLTIAPALVALTMVPGAAPLLHRSIQTPISSPAGAQWLS